MARVTFVAHQGDPTALLRTLFVRVYDSEGRQVLSDEFIIGVQDIDIKIVDIPAGTYYVWARADGVQFAWRQEIQVYDEEPYSVITLQGNSTFRGQNHDSVLLYGWVGTAAPNVRSGKHPVSHSTTIYSGFSRIPVYASHDIVFRLLSDGSRRDGILMGRESLKVGYDRNGYFETELRPSSVYEVIIPGYPLRKLKTPVTGVVDLRECIASVANTHLYTLG